MDDLEKGLCLTDNEGFCNHKKETSRAADGYSGGANNVGESVYFKGVVELELKAALAQV